MVPSNIPSAKNRITTKPKNTEDKQEDPTDGTGHAAGEADELSDWYEPPGGADTRLAQETAERSA